MTLIVPHAAIPPIAAEPRADASPQHWLSCPLVAAQLHRVEQTMIDHVRTGDARADEICTHLAQAGGKRLRPGLVLLAARFGVRDDPNLILVAAAIELLHLATLYHDDVVDRSPRRRQRASVNALWGNNAAIHAGTYLFARAMEGFAMAGETINRTVSEALVDLWKGQMREIEAAYRLDSTPADHLRAVEGKTAVLYELPCRLGAALAAASPETAATLHAYGRELGMAFQLTDDLLDLLADENSLGKPVGGDLRDGIYTLSTLYALERGGPAADRLRLLLAGADLTDESLREAVDVLHRQGALDRARETAGEFVRRAKRHAHKLPAGTATDSLLALADVVANRVPND